MKNVLMLKFGELFLKGKNKKEFMKVLKRNLISKYEGIDFKLYETQGRLVVSDFHENDLDVLVEKTQEVFGLIGVAVATEFDTSLQAMEDFLKKLDVSEAKTFKVEVKRADKKFEMTSMGLERHLGGLLLDFNKHLKVDVRKPELVVTVEIRDNGKTYVYKNLLPCAGGLPLSTAGRGCLLLSGGIDSPVAAYLMAKRGLSIDAVHFHSYPYTSMQAKEKVIELAQRVSKYCGKMTLHIVSFTEIQEQINKNCDSEYMITIMRRIMMRIAEKISLENNLGALITGESLGQVASQTMQSMNVTNSVVSIPVFRPLVAFDKEQIMDIAKKIDTYETSILPYEDCCTVFLPKNPVIKPTIKRAEYLEKNLDIDGLIEQAIASKEIVLVDEY